MTEFWIAVVSLAVGVVAGLWLRSRQLGEAKIGMVAAEKEVDLLQKAAAEREDDQEQIKAVFKALAGEALQTSNEQFLKIARDRLQQSEDKAASDISSLIKPLKERLDQIDKLNRDLEKSREGAYEGLKARLENQAGLMADLQRSNTQLSTALRGSSGAQGKWGEMALRNIVDSADMTEHCDFVEQETDSTGKRPDVVVRLPGGGRIPIDAKVVLKNYQDACDAEDPDQRGAALKKHKEAVQEKVDQLAKKDYAQAAGGKIDFTVMFMPSEPAYAAACGEDPHLHDKAMEKRVLIATPVTLMALLRTVGVGWMQLHLSDNVEKVRVAAKDLFDRVCTFTGHLETVGKGLGGAVGAYNQAVGSYGKRVQPAGKRLDDLKVQSKGHMADLSPIDEQVRPLLPSQDEESPEAKPPMEESVG